MKWWNKSWNPTTGCSPASDGCLHCWAKAMAGRFPQIHEIKDFSRVRCHIERLKAPLHWRKRYRVAVSLMGDLFHPDVPDQFLHQVLNVMQAASRQTFIVLTKRSKRMVDFMRARGYAPGNAWFGVTVESSENLYRLDDLRKLYMFQRFVSIEPLLEDLGDVNLGGMLWAIVGGESGPGARSMDPDWARKIRDQCAKKHIAFLMKQISGRKPIPKDLMIQQYPELMRLNHPELKS